MDEQDNFSDLPEQALPTAPKRNLRVSEFCARAPMSRSTFWDLVKAEKIPVIRFGTLTVVPFDAAERILREGTN